MGIFKKQIKFRTSRENIILSASKNDLSLQVGGDWNKFPFKTIPRVSPRTIIETIAPRQRWEIVQALSHEKHHADRYLRAILFTLEMEHMLNIQVGNYQEIASEFERHQIRNLREDGQYMRLDGVEVFVTDPAVLGRLHFGEVCQEVLRREISVREAIAQEWLPRLAAPESLDWARNTLVVVQTQYQEEVEKLAISSLAQKLESRTA